MAVKRNDGNPRAEEHQQGNFCLPACMLQLCWQRGWWCLHPPPPLWRRGASAAAVASPQRRCVFSCSSLSVCAICNADLCVKSMAPTPLSGYAYGLLAVLHHYAFDHCISWHFCACDRHHFKPTHTLAMMVTQSGQAQQQDHLSLFLQHKQHLLAGAYPAGHKGPFK